METRSKARQADEPLGELIPATESLSLEVSTNQRGSASAARSSASRTSRGTMVRRAEYEAELELAKIKEDLIRKKLALDIAEIKDDVEDTCTLQEADVDQAHVKKWLEQQNAANASVPHTAVIGAPVNGAPTTSKPMTSTLATRPPQTNVPVTSAPVNAAPMTSAPPLTGGAATAPPPAHYHYWHQDTQRTMPLAVPMIRYELPKFGGDPAEWLLFKKIFERSTREMMITDFENISRLQAALYGEARSAVEDLIRSGSDPNEIILTLDQEFGHPNLLLECALKKIRALPRVTESGRELRQFTSVVRNCVSLLQNIKADGYINNPQLVCDLLNKLTPMQKAQYGEYVMKLDNSYHEDLRVSPNLNIVVDFLNHLSRASSYYIPVNIENIQSQQKTQSANTYNRLFYNNPVYANGRRNVNPSAAGPTRPHGYSNYRAQQPKHHVLTNVESSSPPPGSTVTNITDERKCDVCGGQHELPECATFCGYSYDQKWDYVKDKKLCFKCIVERHNRYKCRANRCAKCRSSHHTLLHRPAVAVADTNARPPTSAPPVNPQRSTPSTNARRRARGLGDHPTEQQVPYNAESVTNIGEHFSKSLLKVLPVILTDKDNNDICTYALLDDGATVSLIDDSLCNNLNGPVSALKIVSARGQSVTDNNSRRVTALIRGPSGGSHCVKLRTIANLNLPPQTMPAGTLVKNRHLCDLDSYCVYKNVKPLVLLGQDNWELIVNDVIRRGKSGQPVASRTKLGWVVHGPLGLSSDSVEGTDSVNFISEPCSDLHELVKRQFELESIGITEVSRKNVEHERALAILNKTSRRVEGGWEVGLLWVSDTINLPDNFNHAFKRLNGIEAKMTRDQDFATAYTRQVDRLIEEKYAKPVKQLPSDPVWYLPHFGVTNPNKPNKLRLVFDAAATYGHTSLNENLLTGPDMLNSLLGVLFKFRLGPIAYTADIADMFLRIKIRKEDRGAQLFLWRGNDRNRQPDVYVMDSMIFGAKSSPTSAIFILNKNASEYEHSKPDAVRAIRERHYMDDYLDSVETVPQARQLIKDVSEVHAAGGFVIRGWTTNSPELRAELPAVVPGNVNLDRSPSSTERTLGMMWVPDGDDFKFDLSFKRLPGDVVDGGTVPTKRQFLSFIMSVFDPLGFLHPYTIRSKILLQKIWKSGIGWDEKLKEPEVMEWERLLYDMKILVTVQIPRWYGLVPADLELHVFGDAAEQGYAAVAYLVGRNREGQISVALIAGKARVAPLKVVSIPRLELQAGVLACRLACTIKKELGSVITGTYLWTDSKTVMKWIRSDPRDFQKYVSHRLAEIDRKSNTSDWRWVPSAQNPADEATKLRWPTVPKLWFTGPAFLYLPKSGWPESEFDDEPSDALPDTERIEQVHVINQHVPLIDVTRFSSWTRAVRTAARVLLFVGICRKKKPNVITADILHAAEMLLIKKAQSESYPRELITMTAGNPPPQDSKLKSLDPFIYEADGLLRVRGRLSAASQLGFDEKHPIILDGRSLTAQLLINHYHRKALHGNTNTVINCIRERFWITRLRACVKSVVSKCQFCRIMRAKPSEPKMGDLPSARLVDTKRAFVHCGIDYFGPMEVAIGRRREKRWGVLFTCLVTRAVHLELAASLSTDSAIMALRRFVARRGQPAVMFSDRGTNFVGADAELKAAIRSLNYGKMQEDVATRGIMWRFNPPAAPHMGGCWERLIRSVKVALKTTLHQRAPKEEVLLTLLAEAEMLINSRPLTYVSGDPDEPVVLTPNHLLLGTASGASTLGNFDAVDLDARKAWRKAQALADMFWGRWLREYVPTLQKRQKWTDAAQSVQVGDLVLIFDKNQPRNTWPRGRITAVYPGRDGHVRIVDVKTASGIVKRPVVRLVPLPVC